MLGNATFTQGTPRLFPFGPPGTEKAGQYTAKGADGRTYTLFYRPDGFINGYTGALESFPPSDLPNVWYLAVSSVGGSSAFEDLTIICTLEFPGLAIGRSAFASGSITLPPSFLGFRVASAMAEINGTAVRNIINGTAAAEMISALGGNDIINAGAGDDVVNGGTGSDQLFGEDGSDELIGEDGADRLEKSPRCSP